MDTMTWASITISVGALIFAIYTLGFVHGVNHKIKKGKD